MREAAPDLSLLQRAAHSPSMFAVNRALGADAELTDFCVPGNPYFPTPEMFGLLADNLEGILRYYPSDAGTITDKLSSVLGLHPQTMVMSNGSTEIITWLDHLLVKESIAIPIPTFGRWTDQPLETGKRVDMYLLNEMAGYQLDVDDYLRFIRSRGSRVAVICNPNNPDGSYLPRREVLRFVDSLHDLDLVVVDESFIDFVDAERYPSIAQDAGIRSNVLVLKSLGKSFGLHGIRLGYGVGNPALVSTLSTALPTWNLSSLAEAVVFMLADHTEEYQESLRLLTRDRQQMTELLSQVPGLTIFPSQGNFILVKLPPGWEGVGLKHDLLTEAGLLIRDCGNKLGMSSQFVRLAVRPRDDVIRLVEGMLGYSGQIRGDQFIDARPDDAESGELIALPAAATPGPRTRMRRALAGMHAAADSSGMLAPVDTRRRA